MSTSLEWSQILLRLALTVVAGLALGFNRSEHGKAAGLRTTLLVCVAAAVAMIQVNLLLPMAGRSASSFVMNDLMRLPLGILTGVGFIGGGAILRRGEFATGVTTAATLWLATVIGLCLGGGQLMLGMAATALGLLALWPLAWFEQYMPRQRTAALSIALDRGGPTHAEIRRQVAQAGISILDNTIRLECANERRELIFKVRYLRMPLDTSPPALLAQLAAQAGILKVVWRDAN